MSSQNTKKREEQAKLRMISQAKDGKPEQVEQAQNEYTLSVVDDKLKYVLKDPNGYIISIDFFQISEISRVSYNVVMDQLTLITKETMGDIGETKIPVRNNQGQVISNKLVMSGQIRPFKTVIEGRVIIEPFLKVWLNRPSITKAEQKAFEEIFEGFKAHDAARAKIAAITEQKLQEAEGNKAGVIINTEGKPLKV